MSSSPFTLYAPYVAMPHIRIMRRDMAVAMQISAEEKTPSEPDGGL